MSRLLSLLPAFSVALALVSPAYAGSTAPVPGAGFGPFTIKVEIDGVTQGVFHAVEGLASESEVLHWDDSIPYPQVPGSPRLTRLVLKRPYDPLLNGLWGWRQSVADGNVQMRDGHILIFNASGQLAAHWVFHQGWPSRWEVPVVKADSEEPAEEIIEIVHTGLTLEPSGGF